MVSIRRPVYVAVTVLHVALYILATLLIASYYQHNVAWNEPIDWGRLLAALPDVEIRHVQQATSVVVTIIFAVSVCLSLVVLVFFERFTSTAIRSYFLIQAGFVLLEGGWMGVFSVAYAVLGIGGPLDGEWLGEHWPTGEVWGLWGVFSAVVALKPPFHPPINKQLAHLPSRVDESGIASGIAKS